jgi:hypothetical protein
MTPAQAKRQREALLRDIARELKKKNRDNLVALRGRLRQAKEARRVALGDALARCSRARTPPVRELIAAIRAERRAARGACRLQLKTARAIGDEVTRSRAMLKAEKKYQRDLRRIERGNRRKLLAAARRPGIARARQSESDDEVRGNIPPELVALFERVKRQIRGDELRTRTEAFLEYAEAHPDEQWESLEDSVDRTIAELERRQAMPNPKKKKKKKKSGRKTARASCAPKKAPKRAAARKKNPAKARKPKKAPPRARPTIVDPDWAKRIIESTPIGISKRRPRARVKAKWWRRPPAERAGIVRQLARGTPNQRGAALALARLELRHHPKKKTQEGLGV